VKTTDTWKSARLAVNEITVGASFRGRPSVIWDSLNKKAEGAPTEEGPVRYPTLKLVLLKWVRSRSRHKAIPSRRNMIEKRHKGNDLEGAVRK
jgi:hypothetical protein